MEEKEFPKKYKNRLKMLDGFEEDVQALSTEEAKKMINKCAQNIYEIEESIEKDEKLNGAKSLVKELSSPYKDNINLEEAKMKFVLFVLEGRGVKL